MDWVTISFVMVGLIILLCLIGVPIAASVGLPAFLFCALVLGLGRSAAILGQEIVHFWSSYSLLAVPAFVLMGEFMFVSGIGSDLFDMCSKWLGHLRGGLVVVTVGALAIFGAMTGSTTSAAVTFSLVAVPEMLKRGYSKSIATGCVVAGGTLAHTIPPSIAMVIFSSLAELSAGRMFIAGIVPGIVLALAMAATAVVWATVKPNAAPREPSPPWRERFISLRKVLMPVAIIVAVLGTIYMGIATVTEAAALGCLASFIFCLTTRRLSRRRFGQMLLEAVRIAAFIMFVAVSGKILGWVVQYYMIGQHLFEAIERTQVHPLLLIGLIQVAWLILGCFIDTIGVMVISIPILLPVIVSFGFDPYWFAILFLINFEAGLITPPMGLTVYAVHGTVKDVSLGEVMRGSLVFCLPIMAVLVLLVLVPSLATWLPNRMMGQG